MFYAFMMTLHRRGRFNRVCMTGLRGFVSRDYEISVPSGFGHGYL